MSIRPTLFKGSIAFLILLTIVHAQSVFDLQMRNFPNEKGSFFYAFIDPEHVQCFDSFMIWLQFENDLDSNAAKPWDAVGWSGVITTVGIPLFAPSFQGNFSVTAFAKGPKFGEKRLDPFDPYFNYITCDFGCFSLVYLSANDNCTKPYFYGTSNSACTNNREPVSR
jgi:hypothetical protein